MENKRLVLLVRFTNTKKQKIKYASLKKRLTGKHNWTRLIPTIHMYYKLGKIEDIDFPDISTIIAEVQGGATAHVLLSSANIVTSFTQTL